MYAIEFAAFVKQPILPANVLSMLLAVILATGTFQLAYTKWHALPDEEQTIDNAWVCWAKKVLLCMKFRKVASNMGRWMNYGMNTTNNTTKELDGFIEDVVQGHAATQNIIQNLTQGFPELRAGMQQQSP